MEERLLSLVAKIYDAGLDPSLWSEVVGDTVALLGGHMGHLDQRFPQNGMSISFDAASGVDPGLGQLWAEQFALSDPWMIAIDRHVSAGQITTGNAYVDFAEFQMSDCYNSCYRPAEILDGMVIPFRKEAGAWCYMIVDCGGSKPAFDARDFDLARKLYPHLARALGFREKVAHLERLAGTYELALDAFDAPLLVLGDNGRVLFANPSAVSLMSRVDTPFGQRAGHFLIGDAAAQTALETALRQPLFAPPAIAVSRPDSMLPFLVHLMPLAGARLRDLSPGRGSAVALVALSDPARLPAGRLKALAAAFGFTPAEAQVAWQVASGAGIEEIADASGRSRETVRSHVKSLLSKTDTRRQSELVAVLHRALSPFDKR